MPLLFLLILLLSQIGRGLATRRNTYKEMKLRVVGSGAYVVAKDNSAVVANQGMDGVLTQWKNSSRMNNINNHILYIIIIIHLEIRN